MSEKVILYKWDGSPYAAKVENALVLKGIPFNTVLVTSILPRPELSEHLGIPYRRIPVLAIGNDVYCDTGLITSAIERRFSEAQGFRTLFTPNEGSESKDTGLIKAFVKYYIEGTFFPILAGLIDWSQSPQEVLKDRADYRGAPIDIEGAKAAAPLRAAALSSHLALVEEQLSDGRQYLFNTTAPCLADLTLQSILAWARPMRNANSVLNSPHLKLTNQWLDRVTLHISGLKASHPKADVLSGEAAAAQIINGKYEPYDVVGFDETDAERLGDKKGIQVKIAPEDTGRNHPTTGTLVGLNREELVLEVKPKLTKGVVRVHFPRLGFSVTPV